MRINPLNCKDAKTPSKAKDKGFSIFEKQKGFLGILASWRFQCFFLVFAFCSGCLWAVTATPGVGDSAFNAAGEALDRARFYITLKSPVPTSDMVMSGWRVDDVAALAVAVAFIVSRGGRLARREVELLLREKFAGWRVEHNLNRFIRQGYLFQDEQGILFVGWRSRAEIDQNLLIKLILGESMNQEGKPTSRAS